MKSDNQSHADRPHAQILSGSSEPESETKHEVVTREGVGLPCLDLRDLRYDEFENRADGFRRELGGLEGQSMPAPKRALEVKRGEGIEETADEKAVNGTVFDAAQLQPQNVAQPHAEVDLIARALGIIGSPKQLGRWMNTSLPALQGKTPYSLMNSEGGRKQVEVVLGRIEHGIY